MIHEIFQKKEHQRNKATYIRLQYIAFEIPLQTGQKSEIGRDQLKAGF